MWCILQMTQRRKYLEAAMWRVVMWAQPGSHTQSKLRQTCCTASWRHWWSFTTPAQQSFIMLLKQPTEMFSVCRLLPLLSAHCTILPRLRARWHFQSVAAIVLLYQCSQQPLHVESQHLVGGGVPFQGGLQNAALSRSMAILTHDRVQKQKCVP